MALRMLFRVPLRLLPWDYSLKKALVALQPAFNGKCSLQRRGQDTLGGKDTQEESCADVLTIELCTAIPVPLLGIPVFAFTQTVYRSSEYIGTVCSVVFGISHEFSVLCLG